MGHKGKGGLPFSAFNEVGLCTRKKIQYQLWHVLQGKASKVFIFFSSFYCNLYVRILIQFCVLLC